jgi:hypothetical protein
MLQFVASGFVLRHLIYSQATGPLPLVALRKQWWRGRELHPRKLSL